MKSRFSLRRGARPRDESESEFANGRSRPRTIKGHDSSFMSGDTLRLVDGQGPSQS